MPSFDRCHVLPCGAGCGWPKLAEENEVVLTPGDDEDVCSSQSQALFTLFTWALLYLAVFMVLHSANAALTFYLTNPKHDLGCCCGRCQILPALATTTVAVGVTAVLVFFLTPSQSAPAAVEDDEDGVDSIHFSLDRDGIVNALALAGMTIAAILIALAFARVFKGYSGSNVCRISGKYSKVNDDEDNDDNNNNDDVDRRCSVCRPFCRCRRGDPQPPPSADASSSSPSSKASSAHQSLDSHGQGASHSKVNKTQMASAMSSSSNNSGQGQSGENVWASSWSSSTVPSTTRSSSPPLGPRATSSSRSQTTATSPQPQTPEASRVYPAFVVNAFVGRDGPQDDDAKKEGEGGNLQQVLLPPRERQFAVHQKSRERIGCESS